MLQIKTDLYRYVHYTSNVAVCNYQELIGCDVSFMVVLISERHGGLFYKRLAELRANKGVSARDMSLSIGQSAGYINALENQNGFPSMQVFFYICEYLGVTPAEFFEEGNRYPGEYQEILSDLKHLDQSSLQNVKAIVKGLAHKDK